MYLSLDALVLTDSARNLARREIETLAYAKWEQAGRPDGTDMRFWLEAESEWIEYRYVPQRYPKASPCNKTQHMPSARTATTYRPVRLQTSRTAAPAARQTTSRT